jgi:uncharacterized RDD family membrane protein YckC
MASSYGPGVLYCAECGRPTPPDELARFGDLLVCQYCKENYTQKLREGVAPAAAAVEYGGFWIRFVAVLLDAIILAVVGGIVQFAILGPMTGVTEVRPGMSPEEVLAGMAGMLGVSFLLNTAIGATYESIFIWQFAATPGKMALGLKVLRPDGSRIGLGRSFARHFAKWLSAMILLIGYIIAGFDSQKRALHDMICDTRVIRSRT